MRLAQFFFHDKWISQVLSVISWMKLRHRAVAVISACGEAFLFSSKLDSLFFSFKGIAF